MEYILEFEKPIFELENKIKALKSADKEVNLQREIHALEKKVETLKKKIYGELKPWDIVQIARHPDRPHGIDYIESMIDDFHEIHGDRKYLDDRSIIGGLGYFEGERVFVLAIEKGRKTSERVAHNFGMVNPEGYRKALRLMRLAEKFSIPIIALVDTPGAYPGLGAEERGQAEAIADNLTEMFGIKTPILSLIIGEGGSGGALGLAIADGIYMLEFSVYSVISPESCASILWSNPSMAETAANALNLTPEKTKELGVIDGIIKEPVGGAHRNPQECFERVKEFLKEELLRIKKMEISTLLEKRFQKFRNMGNQTLK